MKYPSNTYPNLCGLIISGKSCSYNTVPDVVPAPLSSFVGAFVLNDIVYSLAWPLATIFLWLSSINVYDVSYTPLGLTNSVSSTKYPSNVHPVLAGFVVNFPTRTVKFLSLKYPKPYL